jgi:hypothetical protein
MARSKFSISPMLGPRHKLISICTTFSSSVEINIQVYGASLCPENMLPSIKYNLTDIIDFNLASISMTPHFDISSIKSSSVTSSGKPLTYTFVDFS